MTKLNAILITSLGISLGALTIQVAKADQPTVQQHCNFVAHAAEVAAKDRDGGSTWFDVAYHIVEIERLDIRRDALAAVFVAFENPDSSPLVVAGTVFSDCLTAYGE